MRRGGAGDHTATHLGRAGRARWRRDEFAATARAIVANIEQVIEGKTATVRLALAVLLAEGHLLIEDVPGVGKTKLAKALARSIDCSVRRIQFTPDLLPSDVTGVSVYNQETREFEFKPGAVFANLVVGDEINRASPKTQSALLECMEERQVTVDGITYQLQVPFMVIATQNPIEMEGTYPLPEAQRDRFTARIAVGYPDAAAELAMLDVHGAHDPLDDLRPVTDAADGPPDDRHGPRASTSPTRSSSTRSTWSPPPASRPTCASAPPPGPPCSCCAPPARWPRSRAATTCSPTTCRRWPCRCSPTASSRPPRPSWAGAPPTRSWPTWCTGCRCRPTGSAPRTTRRPTRDAADDPEAMTCARRCEG